MGAGLARAVLIVSGLAALAAIALGLGLGDGPAGLAAVGALLAAVAVVAFARVARFVLASEKARR